MTTKEMKTGLLKGETIELTNRHDDLIELFRGHNNRFCLMLNCKVIKSTITWKPIEDKLNWLLCGK